MKEETLELYQDKIIRSIQDATKHMSYIESRFRNSREYKEYIHQFRVRYNIQDNIYFKDTEYETNDSKDVTTELHHHILLYDIVQIATSKLLSTNKYVIINDVVSEVIRIHMNNYPAAIVLASNQHQLHHKGLWTYDEKSLCGDYREFLKEYDKYIPDEIKERYRSLYEHGEIKGNVKSVRYDKKINKSDIDQVTIILDSFKSINSIDDLGNSPPTTKNKTRKGSES